MRKSGSQDKKRIRNAEKDLSYFMVSWFPD